MALKALLFDVDGTLADTEPQGHLPAYNEAFRELGLNWRWSPELYRELLLLPGGKERIVQYLQQYDPALGEHRGEIERDAKAWVEHLHKIKSRYFRRLVSTGKVTLRSGVRRLIVDADQCRFAAGHRHQCQPRQPGALPAVHLGQGAAASGSISSSAASRWRTRNPRRTSTDWRCSNWVLGPLECVALEDSNMGMIAAGSAGIPTLITINDDTRHHVFEEAVLVVDKLGEPQEPFRMLQGEAGSHRYVTPARCSKKFCNAWKWNPMRKNRPKRNEHRNMSRKYSVSRRAAGVQPFHVMELLARARQAEAQGRDIVHMEMGEPDFPAPPQY